MIEPLFGGADMRCENLLHCLKEVVYERATGLPIPLVIGVLEILKLDIMKEETKHE